MCYEVTHSANYLQRSATPLGVALFPYDLQPIRSHTDHPTHAA
ncbi:hypothetical protein ACTMTI_45630 [Nonomuraea sp. H19]